MLDLDKRSLMYLPGVGPKKAEILRKEAGISSYEDLLFYFPYKYIDRSRFYKVSEITGNMPYIQLKGRILYYDTVADIFIIFPIPISIRWIRQTRWQPV